MQQLSLLAMAASAAADLVLTNPTVSINTCSDLDTCELTDTQSICQTDGYAKSGVGIAPSIIDMSGNGSAANGNANLSLILIDNGLAGRWIWSYQYSEKTLYIGAPPSVNLTEGPPGCAIMMQYQGQTFPENTFPEGDEDWGAAANNTLCPYSLSSNCLSLSLEDSLRTFNYSNNGDPEQLPRCQALAQHVETTIRGGPSDPLGRGFCGFISTLVTVYGGAISGPDVQTGAASIPNATTEDDGCRPVQPQSHTLHNVATAMQLLYLDPYTGDHTVMGGRTGFTPIVTVLYNDEDSDPDVQAFCMKLRSPEGNMLPSQSLKDTYAFGDAAGLKRREAVWYAATAALLVIAWL
ncbi:hypothetical protein KC318_g13842 [Hortaea werneckii]|nr:hypothetical protein KC334_g14082 [Hortaea werneckii]KAI6948872.1 hypothetical protein KC355_g14585 [Hortaea werneckii]KAI7190814.1 hypothetical protein KC324_g5904 [Hortaea werneckii]KAI7585941.1 hypothetical protein KC316_g5883 [Hortaea werneckii]KAI7654044.1 hypothetical protein KC318_g13842 [Hortaea werneckii]